MAYAFFKLPCDDAGGAAAPLNAFLRSHRVMAVTTQWVDAGSASFWAFCIEYREGDERPSGTAPGRIDYREVLPPEQFEIFARLRTIRKRLAEESGVPVFAVFTNEQLADIVRRGCTTEGQLKQISGLGDQRVAKYGPAVLEVMQQGTTDGDGGDGS